MRIHALYHVPFEGLGYIADWIRERGHLLSETHLYDRVKLPDTENFDMLIVMGGPMNVYEEQRYPWLRDEKRLIRKAIVEDKRILGICLGAQLISLALDSKVYGNPQPEIGWFPVHFNSSPEAEDPAGMRDELVTFHWHGDTFNLPEKAERLACSEATVNQAYLYDNRILAIQFHPEVKADDIVRMIRGSGTDLRKEAFVQTEEEITAITGYFEQNHALLVSWLDQLVKTHNPYE